MDMIDYTVDAKIDPDRLDIEWLRNSELVLSYGMLLTDAKDYTRKCHQRVKMIRSELILRAKSGQAVSECGTAKPTDSVVEAYYRIHPDHVAAVDEYNQAQREEDAIQQAVYAIASRKTALEQLVRLMGMDYFSAPLEPHQLGDTEYNDFHEKLEEAKEERRTRVTGRMAEKAPRRRRKK